MKPKPIDAAKIPPEVQRRILGFVNAARRPKDLLHPELPRFREDAGRKLIEGRDAAGAFGFTTVKEIFDLDFLKEILDDLLRLFGPSFWGQWSVLYDTQLPDGTPISAAHAALLRNGKVMFFQEATTFTTVLWDPSDETNPLFSFPANQPQDALFCSGHSFLSDGQLLCVGGGGGGPANVNRAWRFNPDTNTWTRTAGDMSFARWYPTVVTMGDERRALVVGGSPNIGKLEVYDEFTDTFSTVSVPVERTFPQLYPGLHLLPSGEIFYTRTGFGFAGAGLGGGDAAPGTPFLKFSSTTNAEWVEIAAAMEQADRVRGMSVILMERCHHDYMARVMTIGGGSAPGGETAEIVSLSTLTPTWEMPTLIPGGTDRRNVNAVLLPDGTVFVCGGTATTNSPSALYDPHAETWSTMAEVNYRKQYHSVAVLLPSGKVMATGGALAGGGSRAIELFTPPYLFRGARPTISSATAFFHHGQTFQVESPEAADIQKVVLVRPMAVTHQTDTEQRVLDVDFRRSGTTLTASAPNHHHPHGAAPRGYYILFILNASGVPSEGTFVFLH